MDSPPNTPEHPTREETVELQIEIPAVRIGPYKLLRKLGAGGMGEVHLGEDERLNRKVALKLLPAKFTQDADRVRRFELEAKAASALNHPNIITIYEIGEADGVHFIVTEYIQGETLRDRMVDRLSIEVALDIASQMASALKAAHEVGIVHRDIKPENVMVRPDGLVKVLDFGIAKLVEQHTAPESSSVNADQAVAAKDSYATKADPYKTTPEEGTQETKTGIIMGTVTYMSPEQLRGQKVDARADIFSLGIVLYEVITGASPFAGNTEADRIAAILEREPAPLADRRPEVPSDLQHIVSKALRKDRDARYQLVDDLLVDLKDLNQELEFQAKLGRTTHLEGGFAGPAEVAQNGSSVEMILAKIKGGNRGALLALAIVIIATIIIGVLAYTGYFRGAGSGITSIAVLPFANLSNDPEKDYLTDGIAES